MLPNKLTRSQHTLLAATAAKYPGAIYVTGSARSQMAREMADAGLITWEPPVHVHQVGGLATIREAGKKALIEAWEGYT